MKKEARLFCRHEFVARSVSAQCIPFLHLLFAQVDRADRSVGGHRRRPLVIRGLYIGDQAVRATENRTYGQREHRSQSSAQSARNAVVYRKKSIHPSSSSGSFGWFPSSGPVSRGYEGSDKCSCRMITRLLDADRGEDDDTSDGERTGNV
jgi:hypothetical protein